MELNFHMGTDLNASNDNLWFTLLFKRPKWFNALADQKEKTVFKGLNVLTKAMMGVLEPLPDELDFIMSAAAEMADAGHDHLGSGRGGWAVRRAWHMLRSRSESTLTSFPWGWKEPNTHVYLFYLGHYFADLKYIHVMRHGLDMAYSANQAQLHNWGPLFNLKAPESSERFPVVSLEYWIRANKRAIETGRHLGRGRFFLLNYDKLCTSPESEIRSLTSFLGLKISRTAFEAVCRLPRKPPSMDRYQKHDLSVFRPESLNEVRQLGFQIHENTMSSGERHGKG